MEKSPNHEVSNARSERNRRFVQEDNPSWSEIEREVIAEAFHVVELDQESERLQGLRTEVRDVVIAVSISLSEALLREIENDEKYPYFKQKMRDFTREAELHLGTFTLETTRHFNARHRYGIEQVEHDAVVVTFQLPKQLKEWWWKGGRYDAHARYQNVDSSVIAWGAIYQHIIDVTWETLHTETTRHQLSAKRLNEVGDHTDDYYYIWSFTKQN